MRGLTLLLVIALCAAFAPAASAHDSEAPRDAVHRWLPDEAWSHKHWVPYDETRLYSLLGIDTRTLFDWLYDDHRTLADLARRRGVSPRTLAKRLMEPRRDSVSAHEYRVLRRRAERTLTQGHLAQHVFFHVFHGLHMPDVRELLGVGQREYARLRARRMSRYEIARIGGRSREHVRGLVVESMEHAAMHGVHIGATTQEQADRMLARQMRVVDCWLERAHPKYDPWNPFGDPNAGHREHTRSERPRIVRRKPPKGCWTQLPAA